MNARVFAASLGCGILGSAVTAGLLWLLNYLLVVYPPRSMVIGLLFGLPAGFLFCFFGYQLYAWSGFLVGSLFGALAGTISGAISGIGFLFALYYGRLQPTGWELFANGLVGGLIGAVTGAIAGKTVGPLFAKIARIEY